MANRCFRASHSRFGPEPKVHYKIWIMHVCPGLLLNLVALLSLACCSERKGSHSERSRG